MKLYVVCTHKNRLIEAIDEHIQHTIIISKIGKTILNNIHLPPDLALWLTLSGSTYPYLEQISMIPNVFEPLKFDYLYIKCPF